MTKFNTQKLCKGTCNCTTPHTTQAVKVDGIRTMKNTCKDCGYVTYGRTGTSSVHYEHESKPVKHTTAQQRIAQRATKLRAKGHEVTITDGGLGLTYDGDWTE